MTNAEQRKKRAAEVLDRAMMGDLNNPPRFEGTESLVEALAKRELARTKPVRSPAEILDSAIEHAEVSNEQHKCIGTFHGTPVFVSGMANDVTFNIDEDNGRIVAPMPTSASAINASFVSIDWQDEPTSPGVEPWAVLREALERAEAMLPHGIECLFERQAATREHVVVIRCPHCRASTGLSVADGALDDTSPEWLAGAIDVCARVNLRDCIAATCCDPLDRYVDGLRVRECLERYVAWQREDSGSRMKRMRDGYLNRQQVDAARSAWSSALHAKQQAERERERMAIVVDDDRWDV